MITSVSCCLSTSRTKNRWYSQVSLIPHQLLIVLGSFSDTNAQYSSDLGRSHLICTFPGPSFLRFLVNLQCSTSLQLCRLIYAGIPNSIPAVVSSPYINLMNFAPQLSASTSNPVDPQLLIAMKKGFLKSQSTGSSWRPLLMQLEKTSHIAPPSECPTQLTPESQS